MKLHSITQQISGTRNFNIISTKRIIAHSPKSVTCIQSLGSNFIFPLISFLREIFKLPHRFSMQFLFHTWVLVGLLILISLTLIAIVALGCVKYILIVQSNINFIVRLQKVTCFGFILTPSSERSNRMIRKEISHVI